MDPATLRIVRWAVPFLLALTTGMIIRSTRADRTAGAWPERGGLLLLVGLGFTVPLTIQPRWILPAACLAAGWVGLTVREDPPPKVGRSRDRLPWFVPALILGTGLLVRVYDPGAVGLIIDEHLHFGAAVGYLETGSFSQWNFVTAAAGSVYDRAWIYTGLVAHAMNWLGRDLPSARVVSAVGGMLLLTSMVGVNRFLGLDRTLSAATLILASLTPYFVLSSRWIRFYGLFAASFLIFVLTVFLACTAPDRWRRLGWGAVGILSGLACLHLQTILFLLVVPSILVFLLREQYGSADSIFPGSIRFGTMAAGLAGVVLFPALASAGMPGIGDALTQLIHRILDNLSAPRLPNLLYPGLTVEAFYGWGLGGITLALTVFYGRRSREERYCFYLAAVPFLLVLFSGKFPPRVRYVGHLLPLLLPLFLLSWRRWIASLGAITSRERIVAVVIMVLLLPGMNAGFATTAIYGGDVSAIASPETKAHGFKHLPDWVARHVSDRDRLHCFHIPSFHAAQIPHPPERFHYRSSPIPPLTSSFRETISKNPERDWIVVANWFRHDGFEEIVYFLRQHYSEVPNTLSGIYVFKEKGSRPE